MNANLLRYSAIGLAVFSTYASAVGFGDITLHSRIGESLRAEVPLIGGRSEAVDTACFTLAPLTGADLPVITGAKVRLVRNANGYRLLITGHKPVVDPIFIIGLRANCGIDLQRDYVLMPELPSSLGDTALAAETRPVVAPATAPGRRTWRASEGDTLNSIAASLAADDPVQQRRALATLRRANPGLESDTPLPEGTNVRLSAPKRPASAATAGAQAAHKAARPPSRADAPTAGERAAAPPPAANEPARDRLVLGAAPDEIKPGDKAVPARASMSDMENRMLKLENTLNTLSQEIDKLNTALAQATEALAAQSKLQQAQGTPVAALPAAVATPPQAASTQGNWFELLFSALAGGVIAGGLAGWLGRKRQSPSDAEIPLAISGYRPEIQASQEASPPPPAPIEPVPTKPEPAAQTPAPAVDILLSGFSTPPVDIHSAEVNLSETDSALELAEIMLSFGRIRGAAETLAQHIEEASPNNIQPWIMLLDLYRRADMRSEFETLLPKTRVRFNVSLPSWDETTTPVSGLKSLEEYAHIIARIGSTWGQQDCMDYLYHLVHDSRDGQRSGFPVEVVEEISLLMRVLENGYELTRRA